MLDTKVCRGCGENKPITSFWKKKEMRDGRTNFCAKCLGKKKSAYRQQHCDLYRQLNKQWAYKLRLEIIAAYGGKCACCGEETYEFLALDHKDNTGAQHRRQVGTTYNVYIDVKRRGFPPSFQLLCHNCNQAKGYYGYCPHERQRNVQCEIRTISTGVAETRGDLRGLDDNRSLDTSP